MGWTARENDQHGGEHLWYRQKVYPDKLAALADRLDAGQGPDLRTYDGCGQMILLLDDASPVFANSSLVSEAYYEAAHGQIPPLPPLPPHPDR